MDKLIPIPKNFLQSTHLDEKKYRELYAESIQDPLGFWGRQAHQFLTWFKPWDKVREGNFFDLNLKWFVNGQLNASYNCLDRHLPHRKNQLAIIWEGNHPNETRTLTYQQLYEEVCQFANVLKSLHIQKGDRVCIYLPMIPEVVIVMLACARIGAIHSIVFGGFSAESLKTRILDAECRLLITADEGLRGEKIIPLKENCDQHLDDCPALDKIIVIKRTARPIPWDPQRNLWYHELMEKAETDCKPEPMDANDPLFILYTSGSTGKPKGIVHSTGGYLLHVTSSFYYVFDYHEQEVFWCTADVGWITGHSYSVYGPLANGATTLLFEGIPNYPTFSRYWEIIDKYKVNIFYTAPTALRALRREGNEWVTKTSRKSLRLLGSVGEPINPDVWKWYFELVGEKRCPIVNTWWQTETGGIILTQLPGATPLLAGSVGWPYFGIKTEILTENSKTANQAHPGELLITEPWPGMMQTVYKIRERFEHYFTQFPGKYLTGDGAYTKPSDYYWITGRTDDIIKISGHRIGTAEIENALLSHPSVAEAAAIGVPDEIKGEHIFVFVTLKKDIHGTAILKQALVNQVREQIGPLATPEHIHWSSVLPKTRSGKIMRRLLRKIVSCEFDNLGDTSTLADPNMLTTLVNEIKAYLK